MVLILHCRSHSYNDCTVLYYQIEFNWFKLLKICLKNLKIFLFHYAASTSILTHQTILNCDPKHAYEDRYGHTGVSWLPKKWWSAHDESREWKPQCESLDWASWRQHKSKTKERVTWSKIKSSIRWLVWFDCMNNLRITIIDSIS